MNFTELRPACPQGFAVHRLGLRVVSQFVVGVAHHAAQLRLDVRLRIQVHRDLLGGLVQNPMQDGSLPALGQGRVQAFEHSFEKMGHRLVLARFRAGIEEQPRGGNQADYDCNGHRTRRRHGDAVPADQLLETVGSTGGTGGHRFVAQMTLDVLSQVVGGFVATGAIFLEGLHHDPVEVAPNPGDEFLDLPEARGGNAAQAQPPAWVFRWGAVLVGAVDQFPGQPCGGLERFLFPNRPAHGLETGLQQFTGLKGRLAGQQLIEQHTQTVNVAPRVNVHTVELHLFRTHVGRRAEELARHGKGGLSRKRLLRSLGDAKINDLGHGHPVMQRDENVGRFNVAMDDALLMRMLDGLANLDEQVQALGQGALVVFAVIGDPNAAHQLHHEVGSAGAGGAGVEHPGDLGMIHQRQGLALGFKAGNDCLGVHPELDNFERHAAAHRLLLLGQVHHSHTARANWVE